MTESGYTPHNLATDLQSLLDHLGIKRAYFIVHSFGGIIALNLACIDPKYVAGLILADTHIYTCLLYTSPSPRDRTRSRMPSSA